ncbi:hypothetical protein B0H13DRAFT_1920660 [Mycena leptocephala]|nr:hypothetical protein B0H13DRAFT_1920660 [Mycena leptocephala]
MHPYLVCTTHPHPHPTHPREGRIPWALIERPTNRFPLKVRQSLERWKEEGKEHARIECAPRKKEIHLSRKLEGCASVRYSRRRGRRKKQKVLRARWEDGKEGSLGNEEVEQEAGLAPRLTPAKGGARWEDLVKVNCDARSSGDRFLPLLLLVSLLRR